MGVYAIDGDSGCGGTRDWITVVAAVAVATAITASAGAMTVVGADTRVAIAAVVGSVATGS
jgi:hypothetical protein